MPIKPPPPKFIDQLKLPEEICVLGTGPNGRPYWSVAAQYPIIGLNATGWCSDYPLPTWWMMCTRAQSHLPKARRHLRERMIRVLCDALAAEIEADYVYPYFQRCRRKWVPIQGSTIAGHALQIAWQLKVRRVVLCGVDMCGALYAHGDRHRMPDAKAGDWRELAKLRSVIQMVSGDMEVVTLSKSALEVPLVKG